MTEISREKPSASGNPNEMTQVERQESAKFASTQMPGTIEEWRVFCRHQGRHRSSKIDIKINLEISCENVWDRQVKPMVEIRTNAK